MKIVILGAGQIGLTLANYFVEDGHEITIVDNDSEHLRNISNELDIKPVFGNASHPQTLQEAGADTADVLIALTASDEVNMVSCEVANSLFNVETKIARVRSEAYLDPYWSELFSPHHLAIDVVITPELEIASSIERGISIPGSFDVVPFIHDDVQIIGIKVKEKSDVFNSKIDQISAVINGKELNVLSMYRDGVGFFPSKNDCLHAKDEVYISCYQKDIEEIMESFGYVGFSSRTLLIIGSGNVGLFLAKKIEANHKNIEVKLIERDKKQAEKAAKYIKSADVICGDALDKNILIEAGASFAQTCISVTSDDKSNVLSALLAKKLGVSNVVSLMNDMTYSDLVSSLGVDRIITPKSVTISNILRHIRSGQLNGIYSLKNGFSEVVEAGIDDKSPLIGIKLSSIEISDFIRVAFVIRDKKSILDINEMSVSSGDRIVLIIKHGSIERVEKLFSSKMFYG